MSTPELLAELHQGPLYSFADWPVAGVPRVAAGVYTVWRGEQLVYVGMAGRAMTADLLSEHAAGSTTPKGLLVRLGSHASGRRSGDQFCIYVCDRLIVPTLSNDELARVGNGEVLLDELTRDFIRDHLGFRFVVAAGGAEALALERSIQRGALPCGRPLLNPSLG